jgi:hypothetical protein
VDAAHALAPAPYPNLPKGRTGSGKAPGVVHLIAYDTGKAARVLGLGAEIPYVGVEQCTRDCLADFKARGWEP